MLRALWNKARRVKKRIKYRGTEQEVFTRIYRRKTWRRGESDSGVGSELSYTEGLRRELPKLLRQQSVTRFLDAPCGDFNWMKHIVADLGAEYIGGDIVQEIVDSNQLEFGSKSVSFCHLDITRDPLPVSDLMMVRDCLFHLSYGNIYAFLENFCRSNIGLLLTTTHLPDNGKNRDIMTGDHRPIYLFSSPFFFPRKPLHRLDDWVPPHQERELCLFAKKHVEVAREAMKRCLDTGVV